MLLQAAWLELVYVTPSHPQTGKKKKAYAQPGIGEATQGVGVVVGTGVCVDVDVGVGAGVGAIGPLFLQPLAITSPVINSNAGKRCFITNSVYTRNARPKDC